MLVNFMTVDEYLAEQQRKGRSLFVRLEKFGQRPGKAQR